MFIVEVPYDESNQNEKTILDLENTIEITNPITLCIRFKLKDYISPRYIFSSPNKEIKMRVDGTVGKIIIKGTAFIFKLPTGLRPYSWSHFCFASNEKNYQIIVNGQQCYRGSKKNISNASIDKIVLGSSIDHNTKYDDFKGEISDLNIWGIKLSTEIMINVTGNCDQIEPLPDILHRAKIESAMFKGRIKDREICSEMESKTGINKVMPILLDQNGAIQACVSLQATLAYPKTLEDYSRWPSESKYLIK